MHLVVARLLSRSVIFAFQHRYSCITYLFSSHQWSVCVRPVILQFSSFTLPLHGTPVNIPIKPISPESNYSPCDTLMPPTIHAYSSDENKAIRIAVSSPTWGLRRNPSRHRLWCILRGKTHLTVIIIWIFVDRKVHICVIYKIHNDNNIAVVLLLVTWLVHVLGVVHILYNTKMLIFWQPPSPI